MIYHNKPSIFLSAKLHINKRKNWDGTFEAWRFGQKRLVSNNNTRYLFQMVNMNMETSGPQAPLRLKKKWKKVLKKLLHRWSTLNATDQEGGFVDEELLIVLGYTALPCTEGGTRLVPCGFHPPKPNAFRIRFSILAFFFVSLLASFCCCCCFFFGFFFCLFSAHIPFWKTTEIRTNDKRPY